MKRANAFDRWTRGAFLQKGLAGWLLQRLHPKDQQRPRLVVLERVTLAPRQFLALVEADGSKFLVTTSPQGAPVFCALHRPDAQSNLQRPSSAVSLRGYVC